MLNLQVSKLLDLHTCHFCGAWPCLNRTHLCESCWGELKPLEAPGVVELAFVRVRYLYPWRSGESDRLSFFLRTLKGTGARLAWHRLARIFLTHHFANRPKLLKEVGLVPIPSRPVGLRDHAFCWAEGLSHWGPRFYPEMLGRPAKGLSQKERGENERRKIELWAWPRAQLCSGQTYILADDVVTTGSTVRAAQEVLKNLKIQEVWCLAYRERVHPKPLL